MARILVIDDNDDIREMLGRILEKAGHEVVLAANGEVGTRLYRSAPTDIVITDIIMPEKEGIETIMELRRDFPAVKIVAISGGGTSMGRDACLHLAKRLGAARTISKPMRHAELLQTINDLLSS